MLIGVDKPGPVAMAMGILRLELGRELKLVDEKAYRFLWVTEFPLFEWDEDGKRWSSLHHPFTSPVDEDLPLLESDPGKVRAKAYDIVLNGNEVGGGSIRIHDSALQAKVFELLALSPTRRRRSASASSSRRCTYGTPPHGGIALGLDRMVMLLAGENSLREVIAFPKTASGTDLMTGSPSPVRDEQVRELGLARRCASEAAARAKLPGTEMTRVAVPERGLETLFGNQDENLRFLEETFKVRIQNHGSELLVEGDERGAAIAGQVFEQLGGLMRDGYAVASGDVRLAAQLLARDGETRLRDYLLKSAVRGGKKRGRAAQPEPALVPRADREARHGVRHRPRGHRQDLPGGGAGGRVPARQAGEPRSILARPAVEAGEKLGFLPGDLQEKVDPYLRPLYDALYDLLDYEKVERLFERNADRGGADRVHARPHAQRRVRDHRRGAEHHHRADEDGADAHRLRLEGRGHRRHHADRPAAGQDLGPGRGDLGALGRRGHRVLLLRREGRGAPPAGAGDHQGLRALDERPGRRGAEHARAALRLAVVLLNRQRRRRVSAPRLRRVLRGAARGACACAGELSLVLAGDGLLRAPQPRATAARTRPTDVLSFPGDGGEPASATS